MKALELQIVGFREQSLENFFEDMLYSSPFTNQPIPVRGICFAASDESLDIARKFARVWLGLGTISLHMDTMTEPEWDGFLKTIVHAKAEASQVGILLCNLDQATLSLQAKITETLDQAANLRWFATVKAQRRLSPLLKTRFLVYLGLSPSHKMQFLLQSGQFIRVDGGKVQKAAVDPLN